jgi:hypothetical protein
MRRVQVLEQEHGAARLPAVRGHSGHAALQAVPGKLLPRGERPAAAAAAARRHGQHASLDGLQGSHESESTREPVAVGG